ncbi:hypothetical protein DESC_40018 [Desulfosarcina cetonica]|nr:hypothetical protein DESC_40018 [Desulfosarcina cetonica]
MAQKLLGDFGHDQGIVVALGVIVAVVEMTAAHKDGIRAVQECPQDEFQVDSTRAHDPDDPQVGGVLETGHAAQIRPAVAAPITQETDDSGFKRATCHFAFLL